MAWILLMAGAAGLISDVKPDEQVVFFPTLGRQGEDGNWILHIHGWVFEPERDSSSRRSLIDAFRECLGLDRADGESAIFRHRAAAFLVDNERGKRIVIQIGENRFKLGASGPNGHFEGFITLTPEQTEPLIQPARPAWVPFRAVLQDADPRRFEGAVLLLSAEGTSVISDIDDTIKISEVVDRRRLLANTYLNPFQPVPGMAEAYAGWARSQATFHYVSSSPWSLYEPLAAFLREFRFPEGDVQLLDFRWKDSSFFNLFADAKAKKARAIESFLKRWPHRRIILVGDTGELDPELYGDLGRKYSSQVLRIYLRDVTGEGRSSARLQQAMEQIPAERWILFQDPAELNGAPPP